MELLEIIKLIDSDFIDPESICNNNNIPLWFIEKYYPEKMDIYHLSRHKDLTEKFFLKYKNYHWNMYDVSQQPFVTLEFVKNNIDLDWSWSMLSKNPSISLEEIEENKDLPWIWEFVSEHPKINIDFIRRNKENFNFFRLSFNDSITDEILNEFPNEDYYHYILSYNPNISLDKLTEMTDKLDFSGISKNHNITKEFYEKYKDNNDWSYYDLFQVGILDYEDLRTLTLSGTDIRKFSLNDFRYLELFIDNFTKVDYLYASRNICINISFVKKHIDKDWNWSMLSSSSAIKLEDIIENINLPWNWKAISLNPNMNLEFFKKFEEKLDKDYIIQNPGYFYEVLHYYKDRMLRTIKIHKSIHDEMIVVAWHPKRFQDWCYDEDDKKLVNEMFFI